MSKVILLVVVLFKIIPVVKHLDHSRKILEGFQTDTIYHSNLVMLERTNAYPTKLYHPLIIPSHKTHLSTDENVIYKWPLKDFTH